MTAAQQRLALVTGASRGIGQAIAHRLAEQGYLVVGTATTSDGAEGITKGFANAGFAACYGRCLELRDQTQMADLVQDIQQRHGAVVILVNSAAINADKLLLRLSEENWQQVLEINLHAVYRLTRLCLRGMLKERWGRIINISSVVAWAGNPGQTNYAAAKAGLLGFSKALAQEVGGHGITVNCVAPGFIDTDMTRDIAPDHRQQLLQRIPLRRLGESQEVAASVAFLASSEAAYITGQTLHVNGGMYMA